MTATGELNEEFGSDDDFQDELENEDLRTVEKLKEREKLNPKKKNMIIDYLEKGDLLHSFRV